LSARSLLDAIILVQFLFFVALAKVEIEQRTTNGEEDEYDDEYEDEYDDAKNRRLPVSSIPGGDERAQRRQRICVDENLARNARAFRVCRDCVFLVFNRFALTREEQKTQVGTRFTRAGTFERLD
jgi:hypothetical protein